MTRCAGVWGPQVPKHHSFTPLPEGEGLGEGAKQNPPSLGDSKRGIAPFGWGLGTGQTVLGLQRGETPCAGVWGPQVPKHHSFTPLPEGEGLGEGG